jgi:hypothetical protein
MPRVGSSKSQKSPSPARDLEPVETASSKEISNLKIPNRRKRRKPRAKTFAVSVISCSKKFLFARILFAKVSEGNQRPKPSLFLLPFV